MAVSRRVKALAALSMLSSAVWASTWATFTDSATAASTFTAGTVDLVVGGDPSDAYAFTALDVSTLKPGDVRYAPLHVDNDGWLPITWTMSTSIPSETVSLASQLQLGVALVPGTTCSAATYAAGTVLSSGALRSAAVPARPLAAEVAEDLCFRVELPAGTGNAFQGATASATFTFTATQA